MDERQDGHLDAYIHGMTQDQYRCLCLRAFENLPSDTDVTVEDVDAILTWCLPDYDRMRSASTAVRDSGSVRAEVGDRVAPDASPVCLCCGETLEMIYARRPGKANSFTTAGHVGSEVFDPYYSQGSLLEIHVCDACLTGRRDRVRVVTVIPRYERRVEPWNPDDPQF